LNRVEEYFDEMAGRFDDYYADRSAGLIEKFAHKYLREPGMKRRFQATLALLGDVTEKSILDAGCGTGVYTIYLTRLGAKVSGIDFSEKMLERTRENTRAAGLESTEIVRGDFMRHDFGRQFDHVLAIGVFDYVSPERQSACLKRLASLARKSVVATFPKLVTPQAPLRKIWFVRKKAKLYFYTARRVRCLGRQEGMECKFVNCGPIWTVEFSYGRPNSAT